MKMDGNVIDFEANQPHVVSKVICLKCLKRWICVRPERTQLELLQCETCGAGFVIETGERLFMNDKGDVK